LLSASHICASKCAELVEGLEDGSFYTGSSNNPRQRFLDHKNGRGGRYTSLHKPARLLYTERLPDKSAALKRELQIKGWSRAKKIQILKLAV
jgi:putative endonuclease